MPNYYDRDGKEINIHIWHSLFSDQKYQTIEKTVVNKLFVSTIWLGLDHNYLGKGDPLIFETCVFAEEQSQIVGRYSTEEQAIEGHRKAVIFVRDHIPAS